MAATAFRPRGVSLDEIVDSYWIFLSRNRYQAHLAGYKKRWNSDPYAATAEAVVFSILWAAKARPDVFEDPSSGGPDFCCHPNQGQKFLVEVTSLQARAAARRSKLPEKLTGSGGGAFGLITPALSAAIGKKAPQLSAYPYPRILAITLEYDFAGLLINRLAAEHLFVSDPMVRHQLGALGRGELVTDLRRSAFLRPNTAGKGIVSYRRSISAVLLVAISGAQSDVVGILHPDPAEPFNPALFPHLPYLSLKNWPITDGMIEIGWLGGDEDRELATFYHKRIS